jgi:hypothetical protein
MFTFPSVWNLVISSVVFIVAARYCQRYLETQGLPSGATRGLLVFIFASLVSWGSGEMVDWTEEKIAGPQPVVQAPDELSQLLKSLGQTQALTSVLNKPDSN